MLNMLGKGVLSLHFLESFKMTQILGPSTTTSTVLNQELILLGQFLAQPAGIQPVGMQLAGIQVEAMQLAAQTLALEMPAARVEV